MSNFPGPYQLDMAYVVDTLGHNFTINCEPFDAPDIGDDPSTIDIKTKVGLTSPMDDVVEAFMAVLDNVWGDASMTVTSWTLWKFVPETYERTWITEYAPVLNVGTNATVYTKAHESILTFRSSGGGIIKLSLQEDAQAGNGKAAYVDTAAHIQALVDYVLGNTSPVLGRDGGVPVAFLFQNSGQNEKNWRRRYRP